MFEKKSEPILPRKKFWNRQIRFSMYASIVLVFSLCLGIIGYATTENLGWIDSLLNASMILTGMGPVNAMTNNASKLFASFYAIYSGVVFLSVIGIFIAPIVHRFLHKIHLEA